MQKRFGSGVTFANPGLTGDCVKLMQASLDAIGPAQLARFGEAKIREVKAKGSTGKFVYVVPRARIDGRVVPGARINGRVAREKGTWKVSCCVPGQED
jgi:hypothetical protein